MATWPRWLLGGVLPATLFLAGCSQPESGGHEPPRVVESTYREAGDFQAIQRHGQLRLLVVRRPGTVDRLPRAGSPVQAQLQAAAAFARSVGLEPVVVPVDHFEQLVPALTEGRGDVIVANLPITAERREHIEFTVALDRSRQMLVARIDDPIEQPAELEDRSITVGFNSRFWDTARRLQGRFSGLRVESLPGLSTDRRLDLLAAGDIDLTIVDSNTLEAVLEYRDDVRAVFPVSNETGVGWGLRTNAGQLKAVLDRFITQRKLVEFDHERRTGDLPAIERSRTLRVATRNSAANYFVWRGRLLGFEYELARRFAESLGLRREVVVADEEQSLEALVREGRADIAAAFLDGSSTDGGIDWSRPYHTAVRRVVTDVDDRSITSHADLAGRTFHVRPDSAAWQALERLRVERGLDFELAAVPQDEAPETTLRKVATGAYDLTLVDAHVAKNAAAWRDNVRPVLEVGEPVAHRWGVRADNTQLLGAVNRFLKRIHRSEFYNVIYAKYFEDHERIRAYQAQRVDLDDERGLSPYDDIIRRHAKKYGFDWRLIAAQVFEESGFDPQARSWVGARGLMQIMPRTARQVGVTGALTDPEVNIAAGLRYLDWLRARFEEDLRVQDRMWFTLAAFNAGAGHVRDARRLAARMGLDPDRWFDNVERAMLALSDPAHYQRARFGYVRGHEPVNYVRSIRERYQAYILWTNDCWPSCQTNPHPALVEVGGGPGATARAPAVRTGLESSAPATAAD